MYFSPKYYVPHFPLLNYNLPRADLKRWDLKKQVSYWRNRGFFFYIKNTSPSFFIFQSPKNHINQEKGENYTLYARKKI